MFEDDETNDNCLTETHFFIAFINTLVAGRLEHHVFQLQGGAAAQPQHQGCASLPAPRFSEGHVKSVISGPYILLRR
jgi:hypothetical protein